MEATLGQIPQIQRKTQDLVMLKYVDLHCLIILNKSNYNNSAQFSVKTCQWLTGDFVFKRNESGTRYMECARINNDYQSAFAGTIYTLIEIKYQMYKPR